MNPDTIDAHEAANYEACGMAAKLNRLSADQAENCDDCEHRCPYCPWRDPLITPAYGDGFVLANGRKIEVSILSMHHVEEPHIEYRFVNWTRWDGGRASYMRKLKDWPKIIEGASVLHKGAVPSVEGTTSQRMNDPQMERLKAFKRANPTYKLRTAIAKATGGAA